MQCANPECEVPALDLAKGVLRLIELEVPPEKRVVRSEGGFPVCSVPSRYFWLCQSCSSFLRIRRWTANGLIFEQKMNSRTSEIDHRIPPRSQPGKLTTVTRKTA